MAVARAVTGLPSLLALPAPLLLRGGILVCLKGMPGEAEVERVRRAAAICGLTELSCREVSVPGLEARRTIVSYRKEGDATLRLPRRAGMAQRQPLA